MENKRFRFDRRIKIEHTLSIDREEFQNGERTRDTNLERFYFRSRTATTVVALLSSLPSSDVHTSMCPMCTTSKRRRRRRGYIRLHIPPSDDRDGFFLVFLTATRDPVPALKTLKTDTLKTRNL